MKHIRILVTGADGQLGRSLKAHISDQTASIVFASRQDLDISDPAAIRQYFSTQIFDFCINTAAFTHVDRAEQDTEQAHLLNTVAPEILASACAAQGCAFLHISTDYVYHNSLRRPLKEDDPLQPASMYARTKLTGEQRALAANRRTIIVRTSWLFSEFGHNFVKTMARLIHEGKSLRIVNDQTGCPTYAGDLALALIQIVKSLSTGDTPTKYGVYNYCNAGETTWYHFALEIASMLNVTAQITPVSSAEYGARAPRPEYSVLDTTKIRSTFDLETIPWQPGLKHTLRNMTL